MFDLAIERDFSVHDAHLDGIGSTKSWSTIFMPYFSMFQMDLRMCVHSIHNCIFSHIINQDSFLNLKLLLLSPAVPEAKCYWAPIYADCAFIWFKNNTRGVLETRPGSSPPAVGHTGGWPPVLQANCVSRTQRPLCSGSTLACCDWACWNRDPVWLSMSGTCVLLLNLAATIAVGKYLLKNTDDISLQLMNKAWKGVYFSTDGRKAEY